MVYDVAVLGLGAIGSFSLYELSQKGVSIIGIDAASPPHSGSSHFGTTRLFRKLYIDEARYKPLLDESEKLWKVFSSRHSDSQQPIFDPCGFIYCIHPEQNDFLNKLIESSVIHETPLVECFDKDVLIPFLKLKTQGFRFLFEKNAAVIQCERAIDRALDFAKLNGAHLKLNTQVHSWKYVKNHFEIQLTSGETVFASKIIASFGSGWSGFKNKFTTKLQLKLSPYYYADVQNQIKTCYGVVDSSGFIFGFPTEQNNTSKIVNYHPYGNLNNLSDIDLKDSWGINTIRDFCKNTFGVTPQNIQAKPCHYLESPDENFLLGELPAQKDCYVFAGCSGHAFKFAPYLGKTLCNMSVGVEPVSEINFLYPK